MANSRLDRLRAAAVAATKRHGPVCSVCKLPKEILEDVKTLREEGLRMTAIAAALKVEHKIELNHTRLSTHFRAGH